MYTDIYISRQELRERLESLKQLQHLQHASLVGTEEVQTVHNNYQVLSLLALRVQKYKY
jgi:hypothetical protein